MFDVGFELVLGEARVVQLQPQLQEADIRGIGQTRAVLRIGAHYVPLDPAHPSARLAFILEDSGTALLSDGGMQGAMLESSNTDISTEFTQLIITQQAYSANTRVISTSNDMVQDLLNMLR